MSITAIILAHYKEREDNLTRIIDDLMSGTVKPEKIVIFIDNPEIKFEDDRVNIIRSDQNYLPHIRFALGTVMDTEYCLFLDDDLSVKERTLENLLYWGKKGSWMTGFEGSRLNDTETPYSDDFPVNRGVEDPTEVDIIIRTYFVRTLLLSYGIRIRQNHPELPKKSLDDVYLSLGIKYLGGFPIMVVPTELVGEDAGLVELGEKGVGQSGEGHHYENRNIVCRKLMDIYQ